MKRLFYVFVVTSLVLAGIIFSHKLSNTPQEFPVDFSKQRTDSEKVVENIIEENNLEELKEKFTINTENHRATTGKNSRIKYIVLHYTVIDDEASLRVLTTKDVSAHYLITSKENDPIYSLVPDLERAWHAGKSYFAGRENLNDTSIGIEIVNPGLIKTPTKEERPLYPFPPQHFYAEYDETQIEKIVYLVKDLAEKYEVEPQYIIGHSDIAPGRKPDPGPQFPWKRLYDEHGIGAWYDEDDYQEFLKNEDLYFSLSVEDIKKEFIKYGYNMNLTDVWDDASKQVIQAFQSHFRPEEITGRMDLSTFAMIKALNKKYNKS